ncbi:MAG: glycosyltransferase family 2 protein [Proteobacteria bacterium]|nr:glycosyltransferase family 2 protein [Pseudomonadota bacterium]
MKISVITVVLNNRECIDDCIKSVLNQTYKDTEYVIVDGGSRDGTIEIIKEHEREISQWISEPDKGIYDAMNKGIGMATGDIVGFLNADDVYYDPLVLENVTKVMEDQSVDACYSDLVYVDKYDLQKVIRYWRSCVFTDGLLKKGWIPPHPTFYVRKSIYDKYGAFDLNYPLAADFELMARFLGCHKIKAVYLPKITVRMRVGGVTNQSITNIVKQNIEILNSYKKNNITLSLTLFCTTKLLSRTKQFFSK